MAELRCQGKLPPKPTRYSAQQPNVSTHTFGKYSQPSSYSQAVRNQPPPKFIPSVTVSHNPFEVLTNDTPLTTTDDIDLASPIQNLTACTPRP